MKNNVLKALLLIGVMFVFNANGFSGNRICFVHGQYYRTVPVFSQCPMPLHDSSGNLIVNPYATNKDLHLHLPECLSSMIDDHH